MCKCLALIPMSSNIVQQVLPACMACKDPDINIVETFRSHLARHAFPGTKPLS